MSELIGRTLGQYQIIEQIGEGGMATVYKAYQPGLNRYVALKALLPIHAKQPGFSERFQREAEAIANLYHPNILPVHDFGQKEGYSFITMRYIEEAHTLKEVMATLLSLSQVVNLIGQIAAALDHAHRRGIIHRDIKPSNVLMDGDWALLTDFGLAKMVESSVRLTASGATVGTPAYMSPEQGQGSGIDHRTDIYSLGVILFEMLTGQIPHDAETPFAIVLKRMSEPLPLPRAVNPDIPEAVERVILKALAREPQDRFASAGEMAKALKQAVSEAAVMEAERGRARVVEQQAEAFSHRKGMLPPHAVEESVVVQSETPTPVPLQAQDGTTRVRRGFPWKWVAGTGAGVLVIALLVWALSSGIVRTSQPEAAPTTTVAAALAPTTTSTLTLTNIPQPTPTDTAKPPTLMPTATQTPTATSAFTATPRPPTATQTPTPTATPTLTLEAGATRVREQDGTVMIYVPAGEFWMGSDDGLDDEKPRHKVYVDAFWIDRTQVTNAQYKKCVDAGVCRPPYKYESATRESYYDNPEFDNYPVIYVSWYQAQQHAVWAGGRLPTEAEWEYAARGSSGYTYPWGNDPPNSSLLNYNKNVGDTTAVGSYPDGASWCGALDMAGNVWEWAQGLYKDYPYDPADGRENLEAGNIVRRVVRGGSYGGYAVNAECSHRYENYPDSRNRNRGFRLAVSPTSP